MSYNFFVNPKKTEVQSMDKPIQGRDMVLNDAGAYAFKQSDENAFKRFLLIGTESGTMYSNKFELTEAAIDIVTKMTLSDPKKAAEMIQYAANEAPKKSAAILALAYLSLAKDKKPFLDIFNSVIRIPTHLYEFCSYLNSTDLDGNTIERVRGWGRTIKTAIMNWYGNKSASNMAYHALKYQQRDGWSFGDVLRKIRPNFDELDPDQARVKNIIANWSIHGWDDIGEFVHPDAAVQQIWYYEWLKKYPTEENALRAIDEANFTWEMIPGELKSSVKIWERLLPNMAITATIRNLGQLTSKDILSISNVDNVKIVEDKLTNEELLRKGNVHPLTLANALKIYQSGQGAKGSLKWKPVPRVLDAMEKAIDLAFKTLEPTGKTIFNAVDISGSMWNCGWFGGSTGMALECAEIAGIMTLATIKAETNYMTGAFTDMFTPVNLTKADTFRSIVNEQSPLFNHSFGATDAAKAYEYAIKNKINVDAFIFWTDCESYGSHPQLALEKYRKQINPNVKAIYVTLAPSRNHTTLADPNDPNTFDMIGFSTDTIKAIQMILKDEI